MPVARNGWLHPVEHRRSGPEIGLEVETREKSGRL